MLPIILVMLSVYVSPSVASVEPLEATVDVWYDEILPGQEQLITVKSNKPGTAILLVLQPAEGNPWKNFLDNHPKLKQKWQNLPDRIKEWVKEKIGGRILSYNITQIEELDLTETVTFPDDFTGIDGEPNTLIPGKYIVILIFVSSEGICICREKDFDCDRWFVVPEIPLGTISALGMCIAALAVLKYRPFTRA